CARQSDSEETKAQNCSSTRCQPYRVSAAGRFSEAHLFCFTPSQCHRSSTQVGPLRLKGTQRCCVQSLCFIRIVRSKTALLLALSDKRAEIASNATPSQ
ncbi:MAG TPA: hypothetical protein VM055_05685, partial [Novosphingobium sp.]|nr:hypothetical protein [Novosphingobium sp.]